MLSSLDPNSLRWLVIAMAVATIAFAVIRPMFKKRDPMASSPSRSLASQRSVEREMSNLLVELSEMTRQLSAQLDTRSAKLEELMRQADKKIAEMRAAGLISPALDSSATSPIPAPTIFPDGASPASADPSLAGLGLTAADAVGVPARSAALLAAADLRPQIDPSHAQIYAFVDQGMSLQEIAHRLGRPAGEVQLIVNLRGRS
jgi:hypothetical protein